MKKTLEVLDNITEIKQIVRASVQPIDPERGWLPVGSLLTLIATEKLRKALVKVTGIGRSELRIESIGIAPAAGWTMPPVTESKGWHGFLIVEGDESPMYALAVGGESRDRGQFEPDLQIPLRRDRLFLVEVNREIGVLPLTGTGVHPTILSFHVYKAKAEEVA
jgi:hypothetical protein